MFANRFTAFVDACSLASALKRNLLLSLAEAEFFRLRWSTRVLGETEAAIEEILSGKGFDDAKARAKQARASMEAAFEPWLQILTTSCRLRRVCPIPLITTLLLRPPRRKPQ
ncbi:MULTISPECIES: hypothetical protein [unclassified Bradyrhizobium]|uniref:hypothetical protein n=1 Tax=unclassified Bradyrhizobium TaxID=2631580 RepID=UPI001FF694DC|nr:MULTISPECIES: hypothetical protein [unclassified Bradyrhizobium]MCJ9699917.1 hypothetical protein [Bradyrhizobium sp. SHOUNA76]MCJ9728847.1 hypothetical protein [Bradyrhizobium sp. PRIMUS42]